MSRHASHVEWLEPAKDVGNKIAVRMGPHIGLSVAAYKLMGSPSHARVGRNGTTLIIQGCPPDDVLARVVSVNRQIKSNRLRAAFDVPDGTYPAEVDEDGLLTAELSQ